MTLNLRFDFFGRKKIFDLTILDRYIMKELIGPFFFGLSAFTILYIACGLLYRVAQLLTQCKVSFWVAFGFLLNSLPQIVCYTLPMSVLLATLLAFGRLSGDCEIIAMRANGISFNRLIIPVLIISFTLSFVALLFNEFIVPYSNYEARKIGFEAYAKQKLSQMSSNMLIREQDKNGIDKIIYARRYDLQKGIMEDVVVSEFIGNKPARTTYAGKALWDEYSWCLMDGKTYNYTEKGDVDSVISFKKTTITAKKSPNDIAKTEKWAEEMTGTELKKKIEEVKSMNLDYRFLEVFYHQKYSIPFSCIVFAMIGVPFGLRPHRSSSSVGLGISLIIIFVYYVVMVVFSTLGNTGYLPAFLACWLPNIIFVGVGIYLINRTAS